MLSKAQKNVVLKAVAEFVYNDPCYGEDDVTDAIIVAAKKYYHGHRLTYMLMREPPSAKKGYQSRAKGQQVGW